MHTITTDLACFGCGYNLRSLAPDAACPECGKPVLDSLRGDRLAYADKRWLAILRLGMLCAAGTSVVAAADRFSAWWLRHDVEPSAKVGDPLVIASRVLAGIGPLLLTVAAVFLLTWSEPRLANQRRWFTLANAARLAALVYGVFIPTLELAIHLTPTLSQIARPIQFTLYLATMAASAATWGLVLILMRRLARRLPSPALTGFTTGILVTVLGLTGFWILYFTRVVTRVALPRLPFVYASVTVLGWLVSLVMMIYWLIFLRALGGAIATEPDAHQ